MADGASELFKAIFIVAIFACLCGLVRLAALERLDARIRLTAGSFLALMLLPSTYLYLRLAFPALAEALLPLQSMAIWLYGPLLLVVLHLVSNRRMRAWQLAAYTAPLLCAVAVRIMAVATQWPLPGWWELLGFAQSSLFAAVAIGWTVRARAQLRIVLRGFSGSSYGALLYLSAGLLALLAADFFVHWRLYAGLPLSPLAFYMVVTPCALYALITSMVLIWRKNTETPANEVPVLTPASPGPLPEPANHPAQIRHLELSPAAARELELHLDVLMREQGLYKRNDLTLVDLASALRVSTHLASELLNAHLKTSFYEFLNRHRAEEAAQLLRTAKGKRSIADIAYQAGFNNPNTFYREFKRAHGVTPAQFRRVDVVVSPRSHE
jgi:AraC-like DNA-binding protein